MSLNLREGLAWILRGPWSARTDDIAKKVDQAADQVGLTNAEVRRATFDHADSVSNVRTTVGALLDQIERRGLKDNVQNH